MRHVNLESLTSAIGCALGVMQQSDAPHDQLRAAIADALRGLEELPPWDAGQWLHAVWRLLLAVFRRREPSAYDELHTLVMAHARQSKFGLRNEVDQMSITMAEFVAESEARGEVRGRLAGMRNSLIAMWEHRFGRLDCDLLNAIDQADEDTLLNWVRIAISVKTPAEIRFEVIRSEDETSSTPH